MWRLSLFIVVGALFCGRGVDASRDDTEDSFDVENPQQLSHDHPDFYKSKNPLCYKTQLHESEQVYLEAFHGALVDLKTYPYATVLPEKLPILDDLAGKLTCLTPLTAPDGGFFVLATCAGLRAGRLLLEETLAQYPDLELILNLGKTHFDTSLEEYFPQAMELRYRFERALAIHNGYPEHLYPGFVPPTDHIKPASHFLFEPKDLPSGLKHLRLVNVSGNEVFVGGEILESLKGLESLVFSRNIGHK